MDPTGRSPMYRFARYGAFVGVAMFLLGAMSGVGGLSALGWVCVVGSLVGGQLAKGGGSAIRTNNLRGGSPLSGPSQGPASNTPDYSRLRGTPPFATTPAHRRMAPPALAQSAENFMSTPAAIGPAMSALNGAPLANPISPPPGSPVLAQSAENFMSTPAAIGPAMTALNLASGPPAVPYASVAPPLAPPGMTPPFISPLAPLNLTLPSFELGALPFGNSLPDAPVPPPVSLHGHEPGSGVGGGLNFG